MSQLLAKHQSRSKQASKQASKVMLPIKHQTSDTSTDDIDESQEPTQTQEVPEDVKNCTWTALTFQESQKEAMATQTFSTRTLSDSKRLVQQLAQTTLAVTAAYTTITYRLGVVMTRLLLAAFWLGVWK
jgi:hypothetical protein